MWNYASRFFCSDLYELKVSEYRHLLSDLYRILVTYTYVLGFIKAGIRCTRYLQSAYASVSANASTCFFSSVLQFNSMKKTTSIDSENGQNLCLHMEICCMEIGMRMRTADCAYTMTFKI